MSDNALEKAFTFQALLDKFFDGKPDQRTMQILSRQEG
jgi:uncharacterized protein (DUF1810 family)